MDNTCNKEWAFDCQKTNLKCDTTNNSNYCDTQAHMPHKTHTHRQT